MGSRLLIGEIERRYKVVIFDVLVFAIIGDLASAALGNKFMLTPYAIVVLLGAVAVPHLLGIVAAIVYWNRKR